MTSRERIVRILNRREVDRCGFWLGYPHREALKIYKRYFDVKSHYGLALKLKSDLLWLSGERGSIIPTVILPRGLKRKKSLSEQGRLYDAESVEDVIKVIHSRRKRYLYPILRFQLKFAEKHNLAVFSGNGTYFWHRLLDYFGMEECFIKMYTHPEVVLEAANRLVDIYLTANGELYKRFAERIDAVFFFNDMGTQQDTMISTELFRYFVLPGLKKLIDQAKSYSLKVALHSCGSIERFIPDMINAGVDVLHPIQANARNMDAKELQSKYGRDLIFMGGLDTQNILPFGTPDEVRAEVTRLKNIFGKHFILSPSHEALLKNVSGENVSAMANEAVK